MSNDEQTTQSNYKTYFMPTIHESVEARTVNEAVAKAKKISKEQK